MNKTFFLTEIAEINSLLASYEKGDLLKAVSIRDALELLQKELRKTPAPGKLAALTEHLIAHLQRAAEALSFPDTETTALELLQEMLRNMESFFRGKISGKDFGKAVRACQPKFQELLLTRRQDSVRSDKQDTDARPDSITQPSRVAKDEATLLSSPPGSNEQEAYPEGYFDGIVEDSNLLMQFFHEAKDHLEEAQSTLVELEYDATNKELLNTIFRNFHTIKGSSAFLGLKNIEELSHSLEDLLALVRDGTIFLSRELIDLIFFGMELLRTILDGMEINEFKQEPMKRSFAIIDIFPYVELMQRILAQYKYKKIGEILTEEGKISLTDLQELLQKQKETEKKFGELVVEEKVATTEDVLEALKKQKTQQARVKKMGVVKVSNEKLNTLIDIVGELVINQSMLKEGLVSDSSLRDSERNINQLEFITTTIKNLVLSMGMVPIAEIFNKLRVVARNTAEELGKSVYLEMHGEETELDRNVIETIYDPLMHIIRNAVDHGIEPAEERQKQGKDKVGRILLKAEHKGSGIEITIQDDGKGIDPQKTLDVAIKRGLIKKDEASGLSEKDIYNFLFLPGFSTADSVTTISGRGVGLDVVKKNLDMIHGRVEIISEPGKYTRFVIKLPLTLAIIEGFVTRVGETKYVFPFNAIEEIMVIDEKEIFATENASEKMIYHRGFHIPVIQAHKVFKETADTAQEGRLLSLLFTIDQSKYCVLVDELIGKQEIVIKNLSDTLLSDCRYFSGGTIFGDGSIGFVVDMQGFLEALR